MSEPYPTGRPHPAHLDPWVAALTEGSGRHRRRRAGRRIRTSRDEVVAALQAITITAPRRLAVVGLKGGSGRTTLSVVLATTYARVRGEHVLLFDADTRHGSLPLRTGTFPIATAHEVAATGDPGRVEVLTGAVSRSADGVWVLPSGRSAAQSALLDERVHAGAMNALYRHFPIMITDCGSGLATPLMEAVLSGCHGLVLATTDGEDGVQAIEQAVSWLRRTGYFDLTKRSVVAMTTLHRSGVSLAEAQRRFGTSCADVLAIPADPHLAAGSYIDIGALEVSTRVAYARLAVSALRAAQSV